MRKMIENTVSAKLEELFAISKTLYENPELSGQEFRSSQILSDYLSAQGFAVEKPYLDYETGFRAVYTGAKKGLNIGLFCEYDALPEVGHGCGHNLICTASIGAALGLKAVVDQIGGAVTLFGTPAEETNGAKVVYGERGAYDDIDIGMMAHPSGTSYSSGRSLAMKAIQYEYFGKPSHAAFCPEAGINALDGVILLFNGINALRQHLKSDVRIHGVVHSGGAAANIVPEYACARFYLRAAEKAYLEQAEEKVRRIAEGAALMTGAELKVSYYEAAYDDMVTNQALSAVFDRNLRELTGESVQAAGVSGSMDMGNVSHYIPAIHPMVGMGDASLAGHTREFAACTVADGGRRFLRSAALSLAYTALEVMTDRELYRQIREEFEAVR